MCFDEGILMSGRTGLSIKSQRKEKDMALFVNTEVTKLTSGMRSPGSGM